jgi:hypothetical protein
MWKYYNRDGTFSEKILFEHGKEILHPSLSRRTQENDE